MKIFSFNDIFVKFTLLAGSMDQWCQQIKKLLQLRKQATLTITFYRCPKSYQRWSRRQLWWKKPDTHKREKARLKCLDQVRVFGWRKGPWELIKIPIMYQFKCNCLKLPAIPPEVYLSKKMANKINGTDFGMFKNIFSLFILSFWRSFIKALTSLNL